jgi:hypothetical protein
VGAVSIDVYKKEKEYRHLTLSDANVVRYLIENRSQLDVTYGANASIDIHAAGDAMEFNVELIVLYASLDTILERTNLKEKERIFIGLLFDGHTVRDIIALKEHDYKRMTAYRILDRAVRKVVELNREDWKKVMQAKKYIK